MYSTVFKDTQTELESFMNIMTIYKIIISFPIFKNG